MKLFSWVAGFCIFLRSFLFDHLLRQVTRWNGHRFLSTLAILTLVWKIFWITVCEKMVVTPTWGCPVPAWLRRAAERSLSTNTLCCPVPPSKELNPALRANPFLSTFEDKRKPKAEREKLEGYQKRNVTLIQKREKNPSVLDNTSVAGLISVCTTLAGSGGALSCRKTPSSR